MFAPSFWRMRKFSDSIPEILRLQQEMNRLFSSVGESTTIDYPAINVWEKNGVALVTAELPGMSAENIDISVADNTLTLSGIKKTQDLKEGENYLRQERIPGSFQRSIQLSFRVNQKDIEARYEKGVLTIVLPREKEDLPKKIKINA
ncbi:MAG: Hsp20/alpha crystallin family protein [Smithellaceae bacterium]|jgi:HSP20 family protein|nr:Hsp20/alpha crystallin family protein [Syntrophaceae bacterium]MBP8609553.1 Hsp20/alpha crystallin family protein [Syntrophaceae bacterium]NMD04770.1 Hsp20/alpha crystallin family protein [Deltaproteobacteria bacterium]